MDPAHKWDTNHRREFPAQAGVHFVGRITYIDEPGSNIKRHLGFRRKYDRPTQYFRRIWESENEHEYAD